MYVSGILGCAIWMRSEMGDKSVTQRTVHTQNRRDKASAEAGSSHSSQWALEDTFLGSQTLWCWMELHTFYFAMDWDLIQLNNNRLWTSCPHQYIFQLLKKCVFQLSSLRFATRMKWITTEPVVNVTYDSEVRRERQWKGLYFLISLIFRIITLRTWERFGSLMKFHSSASLRLTTFRYIRKKMDYFKLLPLLKLMLELLQSSVMVRVEHCIFLCFQDSISVSWTWEPLQHQSRKAAS